MMSSATTEKTLCSTQIVYRWALASYGALSDVLWSADCLIEVLSHRYEGYLPGTWGSFIIRNYNFCVLKPLGYT